MVEKLNLINEKEDKESVKFWSKIFKKEKVKKPNRIAVLYRRINGTNEPLYTETNKGMIVIHDKTYHESDLIRTSLLVGKDRLPFYIIDEEGLVPEGSREYYEEIKNIDKIIQEHQDLAIKAIRHAELVRLEGENKPVNTKWIIGGVIAGIILLALLKNYL